MRAGRVAAVAVGLAALVLAALPGCSDDPEPSTEGGGTTSSVAVGPSADPPPAGPSTLDVRAAVAELADVVARCVPRDDAPHPVFHGCIDWHSAVHGSYALRAATRLTGDEAYAAVAEGLLRAEDLADELEAIETGDLDHEVPYGFAWLLVLHHETHDPRLAPLARAGAERLAGWVAEQGDDPATLLEPSYRNAGFAIFSLLRWWAIVDPGAAARLGTDITPALLGGAEGCTPDRAVDETEFLDPCATLALALGEVRRARPEAVPEATVAALAETLLAVRPLAPDDVTTAHAAGLTFSRAWALYHLAGTAGDDALLAHGDRLVAAHLARPELWREGYETHAHWVPQFGIHALALRDEALPHLTVTPPP